ncbi:MAG: Translation initiation factor IF-2 [Candidatus Yanofskybacteria bacterium GW2011_GWF1_44_227]|uniref:Translation initiation factor IF-2 n=1 Tax=Candidatus Yanofskybacteria bacterium GW2011_GWE2_40_11 TaxID=1619033 RepID=A0A0G0QKQ0_9BACT|nr:MAG: Translation initiation factor IF-2 [Candidatus Yanofskybacteria bacterium GW2011_GWE1_40_10]KKR40678.1 MAG: Translation initiation factor IF-2 [Candidatus Yanofskybacteria bacterium GW2011_GWE2_40_11]KKT15761.1 MAG: Translation initiation factor IF-2 [Candidatus Yanofskybacteria bacterium GW2011_GWF2_43_596]KKT53451.1 MAG: Translation initiation factor IF-2 [Candidatus Yanofskybacteria bacterium GW2011_GWF1_44_227]OGN35860.1 MAG: translation initiation factor IF-2 [Candidatus Yanofskyba
MIDLKSVNMSNNEIKPNINSRPPVVVVLGHVDHGKTKLLDAIRHTNVVDGESGGITQHIGAYQAEVHGKTITFLDTPGHEAFAAIRTRGVKVADIAVLVVAADESVKPQTKEAINIIKEAGIPYIVAINKMDKDAANPQRVKQDLASEDVLAEDWGGKVPMVEVSAKDGKNLDDLLDMILLVAEVEELGEDLGSPTGGVIIESHLDKQRGNVATALVNKGVLKIGDFIVVGTVIGKIKSMEDFKGNSIVEARPSQPVVIMGWASAPQIGKGFEVAKNKNEAEDLQAANVDIKQLLLFITSTREDHGDKKVLNMVFKTDVSSSMEALDNVVGQIKSDEVGYNVISYGIGSIGEADIKTAIASKAQVIGFRVGVDKSAEKLAERDGIKLATFDIIYELVEYIRGEMANLLGAEVKKNIIGKLKVIAIFKTDTKSIILGGKVISGKALRGVGCDILRGEGVLGSAKIGQLQHNKGDVTEVSDGLEAGLRLDFGGKDMPEIRQGDIIEIYEEESVKRTL